MNTLRDLMEAAGVTLPARRSNSGGASADGAQGDDGTGGTPGAHATRCTERPTPRDRAGPSECGRRVLRGGKCAIGYQSN